MRNTILRTPVKGLLVMNLSGDDKNSYLEGAVVRENFGGTCSCMFILSLQIHSAGERDLYTHQLPCFHYMYFTICSIQLNLFVSTCDCGFTFFFFQSCDHFRKDECFEYHLIHCNLFIIICCVLLAIVLCLLFIDYEYPMEIVMVVCLTKHKKIGPGQFHRAS